MIELKKLGEKELEKVFLNGVCPKEEELLGRWEGVFLPFVSKMPLRRILTVLTKITWGYIWSGKEFLKDKNEGEIYGVNIIRPSIKTLKFSVHRIKSRVDEKESFELDYSGNIPPLSLIRDELRLVKEDEMRKTAIGIMFLESSVKSLPIVFFGLRKIS